MRDNKIKKVIVLGAGGGHLTEALMAIDGVRPSQTIRSCQSSQGGTDKNVICGPPCAKATSAEEKKRLRAPWGPAFAPLQQVARKFLADDFFDAKGALSTQTAARSQVPRHPDGSSW